MSAAEVPPSPGSRAKGSEAVKAALIKAAAEMLGEIGPKSLSVRDLAERADVNHGQVHHYFGGKRGLLKAAMRHMAKLHFDRSLERSDGGAVPPPLSLTKDRAYFRALCQSVMDGDLELVMTVDRDDEISVPLRVLRHLRETHPESDDLDLRARFATLVAMQLGWFAFEELLLLISEVDQEEEDAFRDRAKIFMQRVIDLEID
jgi:AcrR family transcriptional regulator